MHPPGLGGGQVVVLTGIDAQVVEFERAILKLFDELENSLTNDPGGAACPGWRSVRTGKSPLQGAGGGPPRGYADDIFRWFLTVSKLTNQPFAGFNIAGFYDKNICSKLGINPRSELVDFARENGL